MSATLASVIREAVTDFAAKKIGHVAHGGPPPPDFNAHIAAAVASWAQSDPVLKVAGSAFWNARGTWQERTRAALAAAVGWEASDG